MHDCHWLPGDGQLRLLTHLWSEQQASLLDVPHPILSMDVWPLMTTSASAEAFVIYHGASQG